MPVHVYRFMLSEDLKAIYAYLKRLPPIRNPIRLDYVPPFPFPPVPTPPLSGQSAEERGRELIPFLSSGPDAEAWIAGFQSTTSNLSAADRSKVDRGSYLINAMSDCNGCHTDGIKDGNYDTGLLPGTFDVNAGAYLAGGVNLGRLFFLPINVFSRNLTPHPDTGLKLTEEQFIQVMRFGADFRRPGGSLRVLPHFPAEFRMTLEDLQSVYAYLRNIPAVDNKIEIIP